MKRMFIVLAIVVLAVLLVATPGLAAAKGGNGRGHGQGTTVFALQGCIKAIDQDGTIVVKVVKSKKGVQPAGEEVPISTDSRTRFLEWISEVENELILFGDLEVGDPISVNGVETDLELLATRVTVNPYCPVLVGVCD